MKQVPKIEKYMTPMPHSINSEVDLNAAKNIMREYGIRHLPVQKGGKLVGVLTDRDLKLASTFDKVGNFTVEDAMTPDPFTVDPAAPLNEVVRDMAEKKFGCAVITQTNGKVVGIFTATDGLRSLGEILEQNYKPIL
ncbi:MAG: CBS domain-containing protein [Oligoflexia bacterium]|nr:CBS domain-containing protein [Oligoflexia bacterium]